MAHNHEPEYLIIPTENGKEEKFEILYTFDHDETGKSYMFVTPVDGEQGGEPEEQEPYQEVMAFRYTEEDGNLNLEMIEEENEEEWDMVEEVFNTLVSELEEESEENEQ